MYCLLTPIIILLCMIHCSGKKCIWEGGCVYDDDCVPGTYCYKEYYWSQCREIEIHVDYDCINTFNTENGEWGCIVNSREKSFSCCNPYAECNENQLCILPCFTYTINPTVPPTLPPTDLPSTYLHPTYPPYSSPTVPPTLPPILLVTIPPSQINKTETTDYPTFAPIVVFPRSISIYRGKKMKIGNIIAVTILFVIFSFICYTIYFAIYRIYIRGNNSLSKKIKEEKNNDIEKKISHSTDSNVTNDSESKGIYISVSVDEND